MAHELSGRHLVRKDVALLPASVARKHGPPLKGKWAFDVGGIGVVSNTMDMEVEFSKDDDVIALAERAHREAFHDFPVLGFDIIRDAETGACYVLECHAQGSWLFSADTGVSIEAANGLDFRSQSEPSTRRRTFSPKKPSRGPRLPGRGSGRAAQRNRRAMEKFRSPVLFLARGGDIDGQQRQVIYLAEGLARQDLTVYASEPGELHNELVRRTVDSRVTRMSSWRSITVLLIGTPTPTVFSATRGKKGYGSFTRTTCGAPKYRTLHRPPPGRPLCGACPGH